MTSRYYCIPPFRWQKLNYDLLTRQDREWEQLPESVLACVQRLQKPRIRENSSLDFFRIVLNDPSILEAVSREKIDSDLYHFLVCILTHEMVHMVRLSSILEKEVVDAALYETEESRVQQVSRQILAHSSSNRFLPILEKFCLPYHRRPVNGPALKTRANR